MANDARGQCSGIWFNSTFSSAQHISNTSLVMLTSEASSQLAILSAATTTSQPSIGSSVGQLSDASSALAGLTSLPSAVVSATNGHLVQGSSLAFWVLLAACLYIICSLFLRWTMGKESVNVTISEDDSHFFWLKRWVEKHGAASSKMLRVRARCVADRPCL